MANLKSLIRNYDTKLESKQYFCLTKSSSLNIVALSS